MKDAVGSTMLVYIVVIVVGIVGSILIASNMYTSAYKAKNNIVSTINRYYMVNGDRVYYKTRQNISNAYGEFERYYTASPGELTWPVANGAYVNMGGSSSGYNRSGETGYVINYAGTNLLFFITSTNYNYTNYYRYRDRTKTVTYYYSKTDSLESPTEIFASDTISNVQHWVKYVMQ